MYNECRYFNTIELRRIGSFPLDFNFNGNKEDYIIGMSVPPIMMAQVATRIYKYFISKFI